MNALRFALGIVSGKIFIIAIEENLRIFLNCLFTDGVVAENSIYSATFCESAALWAELSACFQCTEPSQAHICSPASPKGELFLQERHSFQIECKPCGYARSSPLSGELANP